MSTIEKLSIQGVRSFGANAEDMQSITFSSPITLILGQNGCGKTTIIECIKYALTSQCPPGSDSGKRFVHDPKIFRKSECLGQVKILMRNRLDARLSICRSMKLSVRNNKTTFNKVDCAVNFLGSDSQESMSFRRENTDSAVADFMGVSQAIINNVLFCHQEDSSWPLDEPKKLKEKFDAIFGITEYNKALDRIIALRKSAQEKLKVMESDMRVYEYIKKEMDEKTLGLQKAQRKLEDIKMECDKCDADVKPIDGRLEEIRNIEFDIGKYQAQKVEMDTKHKNCVEQIEKLSGNIKSHFTGSIAELEVEIRSFNQRMSEMKFQTTDVEEQLERLKTSNTDQQNKLVKQEKERCVAQQKYRNEQNYKLQLTDSLQVLCVQLEICVRANAVDNPQQLSSLLDEIDLMLISKQREITKQSEENDQADQSRQAKIDDLRTDITKSEQSVSSQQKQKKASEVESQSLELKINEIEKSLEQLKVLEKKIADTDDEYERTTRIFNQEECRQLIANKKVSIAEKRARFNKLDEQLTFLSSIAKLMAEIGLKEKELEKKKQEIHRGRSKHSDNFVKFFKEPITSNYRHSMKTEYDKLRRDIQDLNDNANRQKIEEQSHEINRKNLIGDIARMEKELHELEERIYEKCHAARYDELLLRSKEAISRFQLEHGALKSAENMYKKYIQKINEEPSCPLCHHNMSGDEALDLTTDLTDEIQKLPDNIAKTEKALKAEQSKYEELLQIKPAIDKVQELKELLPKKKEELRMIGQRLSEIVAKYETLKEQLGEPTVNMELANSMLPDMTLLDESLKESARVKKDLDQLKLKLPASYDASVNTEALQAEKTEVSKEIVADAKALETEQQNFEQKMEALHQLREKKNGLKDKMIKLKEGEQSLPQFKERQDELSNLLIALTAEISELESKIRPLKQRLSSALSEKARLKESERVKLSEMQKKYQEYKSTDQDIQRLKKEMQEFAKLDLANAIKKLDAAINGTNEELNKLKGKIIETSEKLESVKTECLNQETLERDLKDNRELKQLQQKQSKLSEICQTLSEQLGNLDFRNVTKEKQELSKKQKEAYVRRAQLFGQLGEIQIQVENLQRDIDQPKYKQSMNNYRRAQFEVAVKRRGIDDLGQHRVALEWALIQFHAEKMSNINSLIREYWRMIYKGNDIDYIQIKTNDEDDDKKASADRRKSYNYRVVQSKNNSEIEMRGRCSAGQRVLGSLIIRMALAETFSSNCGVLALDEPTTNLDRDNIISLCDALNSIVENRQFQSNFMLIIITHDENFISSLGRINSYHRVYRNPEGKSVIQKVRVDDK
ncbi:DNA repair protein RAD50 [Drosophila grimshawi]|uniref:GH20438 n=1 Tax=Drosophila grimshawi TaxID=7222 RepID=B4J9P7_DROGR|nr:DNA repair protein RAD50 [Drosophila grimshawi]EDW01461.1 GH20438 [Drosophila grimshawi]